MLNDAICEAEECLNCTGKGSPLQHYPQIERVPLWDFSRPSGQGQENYLDSLSGLAPGPPADGSTLKDQVYVVPLAVIETV